MGKLSYGQRKFLAEFLANFSLAWIVGSIISPFFTGTLLSNSWPIIMIGLINAGWSFILGFSLTKEVKS